MNDLTQMISSVGFPIFCTISMFFMWNKEREVHDTEMKTVVESINRNTSVIAELITKVNYILKKQAEREEEE